MAKDIYCFYCNKHKPPEQMVRSQFRRIRCIDCDTKAKAARKLIKEAA
jgi:hypothetical protein